MDVRLTGAALGIGTVNDQPPDLLAARGDDLRLLGEQIGDGPMHIHIFGAEETGDEGKGKAAGRNLLASVAISVPGAVTLPTGAAPVPAVASAPTDPE